MAAQNPEWNTVASNSTLTTTQIEPIPITTKPFLKIVEQPTQRPLRFRYQCEGRSAGSIPGANSTNENKTYPTIEIVGYKDEVIVVVSCVTSNQPHRPHPHKLVGRDGNGQTYKQGICQVKIRGDSSRTVFNNLGIQCVKKKEIEASLEQRKEQQVNPFNTKYSSKDKIDIDLNVVRLCFQAFINPTGKRWEALKPQVSLPIYDKKGTSDLIISGLCSQSGKISGGDLKILICEKVVKDDIKIKFFELDRKGLVIWQAYGLFQPTNVHKQTAIAFKTPCYKDIDALEEVKVYIQLERPSDGGLSEPMEFYYYPESADLKRKLTRPENLKAEMSSLKLKLQKQGLMTHNANGQFLVPNAIPMPNMNSSTNTLAKTEAKAAFAITSREQRAAYNATRISGPINAVGTGNFSMSRHFGADSMTRSDFSFLSEEGLTESGLLNQLDGHQLMEI